MINPTPKTTEAQRKKIFQLKMWSACLEARGNVFYEHPRPNVVAKRRAANRLARAARRLNRV